MSNYHILTQNQLRKSAQVVFHIPIPALGTNNVNISWRDAIVKELGGADNIASILSDITVEEKQELKSGSIIEILQAVKFTSTNLTNLERKTQIENTFSILKNSVLTKKQITLEWIGYAGDVA